MVSIATAHFQHFTLLKFISLSISNSAFRGWVGLSVFRDVA